MYQGWMDGGWSKIAVRFDKIAMKFENGAHFYQMALRDHAYSAEYGENKKS